MDSDRFDTLTRSLTNARSRRGTLASLLGGTLGLLGLADATAKRGNDVHGEGKKKKKKSCAKAGQATSKKRKKCCPGLVKDASGSCAAPRSGCIPTTCTPNACGSVPDGCGGTLGCGGCAGNSLCVGGACQPCDVCPSGCTFSTVQDAIDAAISGETIRICAGAYNEDLTIDQGLSLIGAGDGNGAGNTILRGTGTTSVVTIAVGTSVNLQRLRITGGAATGFGGGILNDRGTLTVIDCTVTGNTATNNGGGIDNSFGTMTLSGCTVTKNEAAFRGGGIGNSGTLILNGSVVSDNTATDFAGGIYAFSGTVTLDAASRVTGNDAKPTDPGSGGGIYKNVGATVTLNGGVVSDNTPNNCAPQNSIPGCNG
jgi:hypothetical protein